MLHDRWGKLIAIIALIFFALKLSQFRASVYQSVYVQGA